ncbi:MAG: CBS domain-containing protein [Candidatus Verstraetearchaeota archaeon]|nr:CBS domain-containing protein [Candidatus Verstraetearchaeota archaeon]
MKRVKDLMSKSVITVNKEQTVVEAAKILSERNIGCLVVMDNGNPVGMLTERDIITRCIASGCDPAKKKIGEIMSSPVISVEPETTVVDAARLMVSKMIRRLPVTEGNKLVGIITSYDLIKEVSKGKRKEDSLIYLAAEYEVF